MTSSNHPASSTAAGCIQRVPPASAGRETSLLLLAAVLVVLLSGGVVLWRGLYAPGFQLQDDQIDLATALTPAEQGIHADLQAVFEEWRILRQHQPQAAPPSVTYWAKAGWPPFVANLSATRRGAHRWSLLERGDHCAYLGKSAAPELAADVLWVLPPEKEPRFELWLMRGKTNAAAKLPARLEDADLAALGWRQVVAVEKKQL